MASMASLLDFQQSQGPALLSGVKALKHAGQRRDTMFAHLIRGKPEGAMLRTNYGTDFREKIILDSSSPWKTYQPYDVLTVTNPQNVTTAIAPEVFGYYGYTWSEQEAIKNGQNPDLTQAARSMMYFDFITSKETACQVDIVNGMEDKLMAVPDPLTMEGASQTEPCSFFHLYNEFPNSLYVLNGVSMTTKHQITPSAAGKTRFRNHIFGYDSVSIAPVLPASKNLLNALDTAANRLTYRGSAPSFARAPQNWEDSGWPTKCCFWSDTGLDKLLDLARLRNDTWTKTNELGVMTPVYRGIEQINIPALESAAIYPTDTYTGNGTVTAPTTEGGSTALGRGPRGYVIEMSATQALFNKQKFFERRKIEMPVNQYAYVQWIDAYYQFMTTAPWLSGVIAPGAVTGTFPSLTYTAAQVYAAY